MPEVHREKIAFVICPIGEPESEIRKRADQIFKYVIEPTVSECGYKAVRADKICEPGVITSQIIDNILNAALVVVDLTGYNPNVFYELAVRHVVKKPAVQLIQKGERIPFDVSTTRTIPIDHKDLGSVDEAKKELITQIRAVEEDPTKVDSPISMAVDLQFLKQSGNPEQKAIAELRAIVMEINNGISEIKLAMSAGRRTSPFQFKPEASDSICKNIQMPIEDFILKLGPTLRDEYLSKASKFDELIENTRAKKELNNGQANRH